MTAPTTQHHRSTSGSSRRLISWLLVLTGLLFAFLGIRDYLDSKLGQSKVAESWQQRHAPRRAYVPPKIGDPVAKIVFPKLDREFFVVEGDGEDQLRLGPGHMQGSVMPGAAGNCVIAGHRDTHFRLLKDLRKGDEIVLETQRGQYIYRITKTNVVSPRNTASLKPTPGEPVLHLITCYPFYYVGPAPKRFVVEARLSGTEARPANAS